MPVGAATSDVVRCLEWSAAIERSSRAMRGAHRRGRTERRDHDYLHDHRVAFAAELDGTEAFASRGLFVDVHTGRLLLDPRRRAEVRSLATADIVLAGGNRTAEQLRFRSFYLTGQYAGAAMTIAVQQRKASHSATQLVQGARVQAKLVGKVPFAVPRILETGRARRGLPDGAVADWVAEEMLDGAPIAERDVVETVGELVELLAVAWQRLGFAHVPIAAAERDRALAALAELIIEPPEGLWPTDLDAGHTWRRARRLLEDQRPLTTGLTHGDAEVGNALRLADGRLALVDWEHAARRLVAFDVVKALMSAPDPARLAAEQETPESLRPAVAAAGAVPWRSQLAIAA